MRLAPTGVLDDDGNILFNGRISEVNDQYRFIKNVDNFYGADYTSGWKGFQLKVTILTVL